MDKSRQQFVCSAGIAKNLLVHIQMILKTHYGVEIAIREAKLNDLMPSPVDLPPNERLFGFPVRKYSRRHREVFLFQF